MPPVKCTHQSNSDSLPGDACGVKRQKETYGEPTLEKILGDKLLTKTPLL
jgi:hypothetical protein